MWSCLVYNVYNNYTYRRSFFFGGAIYDQLFLYEFLSLTGFLQNKNSNVVILYLDVSVTVKNLKKS